MYRENQLMLCTLRSHRENLKRARQARENLRLLENKAVWPALAGREAVDRWYRQQLRQWRQLMVYWADAAIEARRQYQYRSASGDHQLQGFRFVTGAFVAYNREG